MSSSPTTRVRPPPSLLPRVTSLLTSAFRSSADISASIDTDDYFELMIRNAWHLSGGAGAYENTSCRSVYSCALRMFPCCDVASFHGSRSRVLVIHSDGSEEVVEVKNDLGVSTHAEILRHLHAQGVTDIAEVKLTSK